MRPPTFSTSNLYLTHLFLSLTNPKQSPLSLSLSMCIQKKKKKTQCIIYFISYQKEKNTKKKEKIFIKKKKSNSSPKSIQVIPQNKIPQSVFEHWFVRLLSFRFCMSPFCSLSFFVRLHFDLFPSLYVSISLSFLLRTFHFHYLYMPPPPLLLQQLRKRKFSLF